MKHKLSRIRSPWRRRLISLLINTILFFTPKPKSRRSKVHWAGHAHRPRRYERLLMAVLLPLAVIVLGQHDYLIWAAAWGSLLAFAINGYLLFRFIPRRIRYWVGR
jgi:hypothetical protein